MSYGNTFTCTIGPYTSINVQGINATFDKPFLIINKLSASELYFDVTCLRETWLTANADISIFHMPG